MVQTLAVRAQTAASLTPEAQQRVEALLRSKADFSPGTKLSFSKDGSSDLTGFDKLYAHFSNSLDGTNGSVNLLLSKDGKRLAQLSVYDIAADPRSKVPIEGRPGVGGPPSAPVLVVGFDDLECPYCAKFHRELLPALTDHYKDQVRVVYQSYPSEGHPWAMRAAVDTDCLGALNRSAYWAAVDTIHAHAADYGAAERSLEKAKKQLDEVATNEGRLFHVDEAKLASCIEKQDTSAQNKSLVLGSQLGVTHTPTLFINGAKLEGAIPIEFVFDAVDSALRAEGQVPPTRAAASEKSKRTF